MTPGQRKTAVRLAFVVLALVGLGSCTAPSQRPICRWLYPGPSCECWYYCDANWHQEPLSALPIPTVRDARGAVLHWRGCAP